MDFSGICVKCGKCKSVCPTYDIYRNEALSPRGRVHLAQMILEGKRPKGAEKAVESCTLCLACEEICPQKVKVTEFITRARARVKKEKLKKAVVTIASKDTGSKGSPTSSRKTCVLFAGCVVSKVLPHVERESLRLLNDAGYSVIPLEGSVCCGFPFYAVGKEADDFIEKNKKTLEKAEEVITCCSTCASYMKKTRQGKVRDIAEVIVEYAQIITPKLQYTNTRFAFHIPCHLKRGQKIDVEDALLKIFGENIVILPFNCCGFGGSITELAERQIALAISKNAEAILTTCPACTFQLTKASKGRRRIKVLHLVEVLEI